VRDFCLCVRRNPSSLTNVYSDLGSSSYGTRSQLGMRSRGLDERSSTESSSLPPLSTHSDPISNRQKLRARQRRPPYV